MPASFADLIALMARLRAPQNGCPWDLEQTYASLAPMLLEEAYEAFEAVEEARAGRPLELRDELGDLLFQIIFYAQVANERGEFTIDDVVNAIHSKMVRRHPHIFGDATARDTTEVLRNWEAIKAEEKRAAGKDSGAPKSESLLDGVSKKIPALMEAHQLSTKAARVGFDWHCLEDVFDKLHEELNELRDAIKEREGASVAEQTGETRVREELGDVLFTVANIARQLKEEPEAALKLTNNKFRRRFHYLEQALKVQGKSFDDVRLEEMETIWQEAKGDAKP
ncbi:MAG: nucleoside triphosphate pyrophosphohydrolase [Pyrinomonadaceae bacterium]